MYHPPYFKEPDQQVVRSFIHDHPFALITGCNENQQPVATQVPLFLEEREGRFYLTGHIMKDTDHHKAFLKNPSVLCVFSGPHTYISATWYTNPYQASTWNYMTVQARGQLRFLNEEALVDILEKTSLYFEEGNAASPTVYHNLPEAYTSRLLHAIAAFEIEVEEMEHVFKLSQNRDKESYRNIIDKLSALDEDARKIAQEMKKREARLFKEI